MQHSDANHPIQWRRVVIVASLALAVRLIHIWSTTDVPTTQHLIGDAVGYYEGSQRIAAGEWVGHKSFYQAPLYPYILAVWKALGLHSVQAIRIAQTVCGSAACVLLYLAACRLFTLT